MLLPVSAETVPCIVRNRERFNPHTEVPFLPYDELLVGLDKYRTIQAAREEDIPIPKTVAPEAPDLDAAAETLGYPVVVKPRRGAGRFGVHVCDSESELAAAFRSVSQNYGRPIVQEFIPNGGELGVYTIYDRSSELAGVTVQRRLRTNPPGGGPSTLRETVSNPALVELADRLFTSLAWQGVAMAEFRIDPRDDEPKLLEINPRLWGSLALSVFAGVDFPYLLYQLATTGTCNRSLNYRIGVQARNITGEVGHLLGRSDKHQAIRELLSRADVPRTHDVFSFGDPLPGVSHILRSAIALLSETR